MKSEVCKTLAQRIEHLDQSHYSASYLFHTSFFSARIRRAGAVYCTPRVKEGENANIPGLDQKGTAESAERNNPERPQVRQLLVL